MIEHNVNDGKETDDELAGPIMIGLVLIVLSAILGLLWDRLVGPVSAEPLADWAARSASAAVTLVAFFWALPRFVIKDDNDADAEFGARGWLSVIVIAAACIVAGAFVETRLGALAVERFGKADPCGANRNWCELTPIETVVELE